MRRTSTTALWAFNALALVAFASLFYPHFAHQPLRIAYVDSTRLFDYYQGTVDARSTHNLHK